MKSLVESLKAVNEDWYELEELEEQAAKYHIEEWVRGEDRRMYDEEFATYLDDKFFMKAVKSVDLCKNLAGYEQESKEEVLGAFVFALAGELAFSADGRTDLNTVKNKVEKWKQVVGLKSGSASREFLNNLYRAADSIFGPVYAKRNLDINAFSTLAE